MKEARWGHLFSGEPKMSEIPLNASRVSGANNMERVAELEQEVATLRQRIDDLEQQWVVLKQRFE
jgi:uncharacterized protein YceH (UPF0502 family)